MKDLVANILVFLGTVLGGIAAAFTMGFYFALIKGYTISVLWNWFIVPIGMPTINIAHAVGISLAIGYLTNDHKKAKIKKEEMKKNMSKKEFYEYIFKKITAPLIHAATVLLVGWSIHMFM